MRSWWEQSEMSLLRWFRALLRSPHAVTAERWHSRCCIVCFQCNADKQEISNWEAYRHMQKDPDRFLLSHNFLLHHCAWGYTFTLLEDIWQHLQLHRSDVTKIDVWMLLVSWCVLWRSFNVTLLHDTSLRLIWDWYLSEWWFPDVNDLYAFSSQDSVLWIKNIL